MQYFLFILILILNFLEPSHTQDLPIVLGPSDTPIRTASFRGDFVSDAVITQPFVDTLINELSDESDEKEILEQKRGALEWFKGEQESSEAEERYFIIKGDKLVTNKSDHKHWDTLQRYYPQLFQNIRKVTFANCHTYMIISALGLMPQVTHLTLQTAIFGISEGQQDIQLIRSMLLAWQESAQAQEIPLDEQPQTFQGLVRTLPTLKALTFLSLKKEENFTPEQRTIIRLMFSARKNFQLIE